MDFDTQTLSRSPSCIQTRAKPQVTASWIPACLKSLGVAARAAVKDAVEETPNGLPPYRYRDLLEHLATLDRQIINFAGQHIVKITTVTPVQARAFDLLGSPVPVRLT